MSWSRSSFSLRSPSAPGKRLGTIRGAFSYSVILAGVTGLEPATSGVTDVLTNSELRPTKHTEITAQFLSVLNSSPRLFRDRASSQVSGLRLPAICYNRNRMEMFRSALNRFFLSIFWLVIFLFSPYLVETLDSW